MEIMGYVVTAILAYLLGSIPTGYLAGRAKGVDIRSVGSKNIGATNVFRTLGKGLGILVLLIDALKGYAAVAAVVNWYPELHDSAPRLFGADGQYDATQRDYLGVIAGLFAILGHNYTCWLRFKGGKGIATTAGVLLALAPVGLAIALAVWIVVLTASRYVSLASIAAAVSLPFAVWVGSGSRTKIIFFTAVSVLAIYKHKANIQRLLKGTENRFSLKKNPTAGAS